MKLKNLPILSVCLLLLSGIATAQPWEFATDCNAEPIVRQTPDGVEYVRTPEACFAHLADFSYQFKSVEIDGLRQAYIDEGPKDAEPILLLHGQPSWSYLYRKMIPILLNAGYRVIAMDHVGLGYSDKPTDIAYYTYLGHIERLEKFIGALNLQDITLFGQDWGSLIGLHVAGDHPDWFARIVIGNGTLPTLPGRAGAPEQPPVSDPYTEDPDIPDLRSGTPAQMLSASAEPNAEQRRVAAAYAELGLSGFSAWQYYSLRSPRFQPSKILEAATYYDLPPSVEAAYDAPYPSRIYMAGIRVFPSLTIQLGGTNDEAWAGLISYTKPFLTIFGVRDNVLGSEANQSRLIDNIPGAQGQPHARLEAAGHFLQDDQGADIARRVVEFMAATPQ